ncbi:MAG TPA: NapC/NirT family cytochrome c [Anaeromyxobacter sp.]|nr:NapC/NirT family cytochrome c [Anaeromyxobacter sp.]
MVACAAAAAGDSTMRDFVKSLTDNTLSLLGTTLATASGVLIVLVLAVFSLGYHANAYVGIVAFLVLPGAFVLGLLLVPAGHWRVRRRAARAAAAGRPVPALPVLDLNQPATRNRLVFFGALTAVNVVILSAAGYAGISLMDRPVFCGSCHSVMDPEVTAYARSPHARVACVECHIGSGASWFVKSKLSGSWQLVSVTLNLYPRPIPTPVKALRPARDTCEECHWPAKFVGQRLKVLRTYAEDAAGTEKDTVLLMRVGGQLGPRASGIHWHVAPGVEVRYLGDASRQKIGAVELKLPDGTRRTYASKDGPAAPGPDAAWRTMDCVDCHNRPTHQYRLPEQEVDGAIEAGRLDRASLPFLRREALAALKGATGSHAEAKEGIRVAMLASYEKLDPAAFPARRAAVEAAADVVAGLYAVNVWPQMKITWGTYPSFLGHDASPGCWRCHDDAHVAEGGKAIPQDCDLCHSILAQDEHDPKVLKELQH